MAFRFFNPNPAGKFVGDCTIRGICKLLNKSWDEVYAGTTFQGFVHKDMPSGNSIWGTYLKRQGYVRKWLPDTCPDCYTVEDFCYDNPKGRFLVVAVVDGDYYDTWDSGKEIPIYYWTKKEA